MSQKQKYYKAEEVDQLLIFTDSTIEALKHKLNTLDGIISDTTFQEHYVLDFSEQKRALLEKVKKAIDDTISSYDFEENIEVRIENLSGNRFEAIAEFDCYDILKELISDIEDIFEEDEEEEED
jgi:hypothetical protein